MSTTVDQLKRAYRLIKRDRTAEARDILEPILAAEPENVHAWWLLAYATSDPDEVRQALTRVLDLDPNYPNAPKALEMLSQLNERYPSPEELEAFALLDTPDELEEADAYSAEAPLTQAEMRETADFLSADPFGDVLEPPDNLDLSAEDDLFGLETASLLAEERESAELDSADLLELGSEHDAALDALFDLDVEELEQKYAATVPDVHVAQPRRKRGWRLLGLALVVVVLAIAAVLLVFWLFQQDEQEAVSSDLGPLKVVEVDSPAVGGALAGTVQDLAVSGLGDNPRAVIAESALGNTLFVEFCGHANPGLSRQIMRAMEIAARQAPALTGALDAVGVSVTLCDSATPDTLYRASVPIADAVRFINGELGADEIGMAGFQALWKTN